MEVSQLFVKYVFAPLAVIISTFFLSIFNKKNSLLNNRKLIVWVLVSGLVLSLPGLLGLLRFMFMPWGYIMSMSYALCLGTLAVYLLLKIDQGMIEKSKFFSFFLFLIVIGLAVYLYQLLFDWIGVMDIGLLAGTSVFVSIIPLLFWWTYIDLISIPTEINKIWEYPIYPLDVNIDHLDFDKLLVLELELYKDVNDIEPLKVKVKAPKEMVFGVWFGKFIDDYNLKFPNSSIIYRDSYQQSFKWTFFVKRSVFRRNLYIDPDLSIEQNNVTEKMTIHAKRVSEVVN